MVTVAAIAGDALLELVMGKEGDELREHGPAGIHPPLFRRGRPPVSDPIFRVFGSNRFWAPLYPTDINGLGGLL